MNLTGCFNFRDLGGHKTLSGKVIRTGQIFRSGNISPATRRDVGRFKELGIVSVCDFRSGPEHEAHPNLWIDGTNIDYWRWGEDESVGDSLALLRECSVSEDKTKKRMQEVYRQIPYEQSASFRELFHRIAARKTPLIFHCAAGKDRTGVAAALLLSALGVSRAAIFDDFTRTNLFFQRIHDAFLSDPRHSQITSENPTAWLPMLKADPSYLEAMFAHIETNHGGVEGYLNDITGLDQSALQDIREHLLR